MSKEHPFILHSKERQELSEVLKMQSPEQLLQEEKKGLFTRLREWSGARVLLAFVLGGKIAAMTQEMSHEDLQSIGKEVATEMTQVENSPMSQPEKQILEMAEENPGQLFIELSQKIDPVLISQAMQNNPEIISQAVHIVAESEPGFFLDHVHDIRERVDSATLKKSVETALLVDPALAFYFRHQDAKDAFNQSDIPALKILVDISNSDLSYTEQTRVATLLDRLQDGSISVDQAVSIVKNENAWIDAMIEIKAKPDHIGSVAIDQTLSNFAMLKISSMNYLHEQSDAERFEVVKNLSASELYSILVYGQDSAYPSTYNGVYNLLLQEMKHSGMTGDMLLQEVGENHLRDFIRASIEYDRLDDFLAMTSLPEQDKLIRSFVEGLDHQKKSSVEAAVVADVLKKVDRPELRTVLADAIEQEWKRVVAEKNEEGMAVYGILSHIIADEPSWIPKEHIEKYRINETTEISPAELRNKDGNVVERYFFYNDEDGQSSFKHFLSRFEGKSGWQIEKQSGYIVVKSKGKENGIVIYANLPASETSTNLNEKDVVGDAMVEDGVEPTVVVHRGHVYHNAKTIAHIPTSAKIVVMGSCGGFLSLESVLEKSPNAHIISTQGTGTKRVNDTLLSELDKRLMSDETFVWKDYWQDAGVKLQGDFDFNRYVSPDQNYSSMFLATYHRLTKEV